MAAVHQMDGYKRHITSEFLADRYPYLEDILGHLKSDDVSMAFGDRLLPRLVEQLKSPEMAPQKLSEALRIICDLCSHQEQKNQAITSDVVAAATNLLMHDNLDVRREAARVINSMAMLIGGRHQMPVGNSNMPRKLPGVLQSAPTLQFLIKLLLGCDDEMVKRNAAEALKTVAMFRDGGQQVVDLGAVKGMSQYLCATLPDMPATTTLARCTLFLLEALASVTMYAHEGMRDFLGTGLLPKVITFLDRIDGRVELLALPPDEAVQATRQALRLLWFSGNDQRGRVEVVKADGVRVITGYFSHQDAKVRETAVCALNVFSLETEGKKHALQHSVSSLAGLLHSDKETAYLHETCVQLVRCASELPAFRLAFARQVLGSIWLLEKIYGTATLSAISPLLDPVEEAETRSLAVTAVSHFLRQPGVEGDLIKVPPLSPADLVRNPPQYALEQCVDIFHNLVDALSIAPEATLQCLEALTSVEQGRQRLGELVAEERVKLPPAQAAAVLKMLGES